MSLAQKLIGRTKRSGWAAGTLAHILLAIYMGRGNHAEATQLRVVPKLLVLRIFSGLGQIEEMENEFQDGKEKVIQAWYMDDKEEDQRLPHHREPKQFVSFDRLRELGVLSWRLNADDYENDEGLKKIREARGYSYMDICEVCPEKLPNYETKIKNFFEEHLHTDEEIRYCLAGSGYFDVRDENEQWIRVAVKKGGMIVLPAGIYHRFTLDTDNYIKALRLFVGEPVWTPYNRPHDHLPARKEYLDAFVTKEAGGQAIDAR